MYERLVCLLNYCLNESTGAVRTVNSNSNWVDVLIYKYQGVQQQ